MGEMQIRPLSAQCGSEVTGVDIRAIGVDDMAALRHALRRDRRRPAARSPARCPIKSHRLSRFLMCVMRHRQLFPGESAAITEIADLRKAETQFVNNSGGWHTDHSYDAVPAMGSILVARELPPLGGDTLFASTGAAYDSLSDRAEGDAQIGVRAVHSADHIYGQAGSYAWPAQAADLKGHDISCQRGPPGGAPPPGDGSKPAFRQPRLHAPFRSQDSRGSFQSLLQYLYSVGMREEFHCSLTMATRLIRCVG